MASQCVHTCTCMHVCLCNLIIVPSSSCRARPKRQLPTAKNPCFSSLGVGFDSFDCGNSTRSTFATVLFLSDGSTLTSAKNAKTAQRDPKQQPQRSFSSEPREQRACSSQREIQGLLCLVERGNSQRGLNLSVGFWSGVFLGSIYFHRPFPSVESRLSSLVV